MKVRERERERARESRRLNGWFVVVEVLGLNCVTVAEFVARSRVGTHTTLSIYSTTLHYIPREKSEEKWLVVVYHQSDDDDDGSKRGALELQYFGWGFCHCFTFV